MAFVDTSNLTLSPEIMMLIQDIDAFKYHWVRLNRISPLSLEKLKKVATIQSIASSTRIEGVHLSDQDVEHLLAQTADHSFQSRDEEEVAGYAEVMSTILAFYDDIPLTENYIKQFHQTLLKYSDQDRRHRGDYKKLSNNVAAYDHDGQEIGILLTTSTPFETPFHMEELVSWTRHNLEEKYYHPLLVIGIFIVKFLAIHPFQDGNGRLARLLTTLLLLQQGYYYVQYISLENIIENVKDQYYASLRRTQQSFQTDEPDYEPWLMFFLRALQKQKNDLKHKLDKTEASFTGHSLLNYIDHQILNYCSQYTKVTLKDLSQALPYSRNTLKKALLRLVQNHYLHQHGQGRGTWYSLAESRSWRD